MYQPAKALKDASEGAQDLSFGCADLRILHIMFDFSIAIWCL